MNFMMLNHNHATRHHVYKSGPRPMGFAHVLICNLLNFWKVCLKTHLSDGGGVMGGGYGKRWTKHALLPYSGYFGGGGG